MDIIAVIITLFYLKSVLPIKDTIERKAFIQGILWFTLVPLFCYLIMLMNYYLW